MRRKEVLAIGTVVALVAGLAATPARAQDVLSLNVDPATECVSSGDTITVTLDVEGSGGGTLSCGINGVQVLLNYDDTVMTLVDVVPEIVVGPPANGWLEVRETNLGGNVDWAAFITGGSIATPHKIATMTFTAIANGTASVTFRADSPPFFTKLTCASDNSTIFPTKHDTVDDFDGDGVGNAFIGPPDCTITADAAVCDGTSGHAASVPDAGVGALYAWTVTGGTIDSGQGTTSISYTAGAGPTVTIDVTVTDPDGCPASCQTVVTVNPNPDCTITAADSVCADSTGNPATVPDAGVGASYVWTVTGGIIEAGQGTNALTFGAGSGPTVTIDITVTDANGCVSTCQKIIAVAAPDCTITAADEVCDGSTGNTASVPDAGAGATYTWTVTGGTITAGAGTTSITYTATDPSSVTIDVTVVGGAGCQSSCQKIVTVNANPDCTITAEAAVCDGTSGHAASVADAGVGATYVWTVTGGTLDSGQGTTSISYTATDPTSVTIDVTVTDGNGCVSSCQQVVPVNANPDCTITADAAVCDGSSGNNASVLDAGVGATYAWSITGGTIDSGQGTTAISYTATDPTSVTIDITVTDGNGCVSSCQTVVGINANPDCTITAADGVCDGSTGNVASVPDAGVGATYAWTVTGGTIDSGQNTSSISYTATDPTTVTIDVTVTDGNGCVSTCQKIVSVASNPTCVITADDEVCDGSTGNAASTADVGLGALYVWTVTGGTLDTGQGSFNITYTAGAGPSVVLDLTVTDAGGCVSTCQKVVTVNPNPDCTITADSAVCDGTSGHVASVIDQGVGATYAWTVTGGTIDSGQNTSSISYTATNPTSITIDITVTDGNGCVSSCQTVVSVNPNPDATITADDEVCDGTSGHFASVPDAGVGATYVWTVTGGTLDAGQNTPVITYTAGAGPFVTIDVTVTDANGCVSTGQKIAAVNANPDCTITAESAVCDGTSGHVASVPSAGLGAIYSWTVTGGTIDSGQGTTSITYTAGAGATLTIESTVTNANACQSICQMVVTVNPNPPCTITADVSVCADTSGHSAFVSDAGVGATYVWTVTGGTLDSGQGTTSITYTSGAGASVTLDVTSTDANGCVSSCQEVVTIDPNPNCTISANDLVCVDSAGNVASVPDAGVGATYLWTVTGGALNSGQGTTSITYTAGAGPTLTLEATTTDAVGCVSTCQKVVTVDEPDCTISGADSVCFESVGNFATVPSAGGGATYFWLVTGGTLTSGQGTNAITYTAGSGLTVTLDITITNANSCVNSCQKIVNIIQPSIEVTVELEGLGVGVTVTRDVTFIITDCPGTTDVRVLPVTTDTAGTVGRIGTVTITNTSPNAEWISTKEGHTLSRLASVTYATCSVATVDLTTAGSGAPLLTGDFHTATVPQDDLCDIVDFSILASRWEQLIDQNETTGADATGDGVQNTADFTAIQVNFFLFGEADDSCARGGGDGGGSPSIGPDGKLVGTGKAPRASIRVDELTMPNAQRADRNNDGVVDARDIRAFAREFNLELLGEFERKLKRLERLQAKKVGSPRGR